MKLRGQPGAGEAGYAMAALLVGMSVMAVLSSAAMFSWRQMAQREKEAELIFRGQQYARAIGLFQRRAGPGVNPPNLDVLVQQRFLRKKYKDPITGDDFDLLSPSSPLSVPTAPKPGAPTTQPGSREGAPGSRSGTAQLIPPTGSGRGGATSAFAPIASGSPPGGIVGVASKSKAESIRIYNGRTHYNEWQFVFIPQTPQPGGPGRGQPSLPGMPAGPGRGDPQRGGPQRGGPQPGGPQRGGPFRGGPSPQFPGGPRSGSPNLPPG